MQSQRNSQGPSLPVLVQTNLSQPGQHLPQNFANNIASAGMQGSAGQSIPSISGMMQPSPPSDLLLNQQSSAQQCTQSGVQQHLQSVRQLQASNIHQQQKASEQPQQQQHLLMQSKATNIQQNQLIGGAQSETRFSF
ncbi:hypothetical protein POM88_053280 [Heracleum sosnowskyi]|uniref:Uncharacterized protein n=1 Tax=Heracleum sosnowskyi TaxID=360622 RepID=A0AAD8GPN6_9APIA|nr:hypothetical protein POM88_053280 [Heracleum sosnowskyi]